MVTMEYIKSVLETLPIGYYLGTRAEVIFEESGSSYCNPMDNTIHISGKNVQDSLKNVKSTSPEDTEMFTRSILYHEVGHLILTPKVIRRITNWFNIFEDERLESLLATFFHGIDFKKNVFAMNGYTSDWKPDNAENFFYGICRYRQGPEHLVKKCGELIRKYAAINASTGNPVAGRYYEAVQDFYNECCREWKQNQQNQQNQNQQNNQQQKNQQKNQQSGGGQSQSGDQNQDEQNDQQGQSSGSSSEGNQKQDKQNKKSARGSDKSDEQQGGDQQNESGSGENQEQNDSENGEGNEGDSENDSTNEADGGEDEDKDGEGTSESDEQSEEEKAVEEAVKKALEELQKGLRGTIPVTREKVAKICENLMNVYLDNKIVESISRIIIRNNKRKAMRSPYSFGYAGRVDAHSVAFRNDYRWFVKKGDSGSNKFNKTHITLWVDTSGSFSDSCNRVNQLIYALREMQRRLGNEFAFDVVTMDEENKIHDARVPVDACGCNYFGPNVVEISRKLTKHGFENFNVVVWDGDLLSGSYHSRETAAEHANAFRVFDNSHTVITSDRENEWYLDKYCPHARIKYISGDYAEHFVDEVIALLDRMMS